MSTPINGVNSNSTVNPAAATGTPVSDSFKSKLLSAGVPQATIDQGREAVKTYIDSNPSVKQALQAEKQQAQGQQSIFGQQQQGAQGAQKGHGGGHKAEIQAEAQQLMQQNPGMSQQQAIQQVIAQFKAQHAQEQQAQQTATPPVGQ